MNASNSEFESTRRDSGEPAPRWSPRDPTDRAILHALHRDARATLTSIAAEVGLTGPAVQTRIKRLERDGVISLFTVLVDHTRLGYALSVHITVTLKDYQPTHIAEFEAAILDEPSIIECYALTGRADFLLRAVARDVEGLNHLVTAVIGRLPHVATFETQVLLRTVKFDHSVVSKGE